MSLAQRRLITQGSIEHTPKFTGTHRRDTVIEEGHETGALALGATVIKLKIASRRRIDVERRISLLAMQGIEMR